ncbi:MAG: cell division protein ZipA C-terminal FtsZ-binding domain-containing protein [Clostridia bacterium]
MTDLQLGLLVIGGVAVAGVLLFNRVQEGRARRQAERAFSSGHADTLLGEQAAGRPAALPKEAPPEGVLPDEAADYIVTLRSAVGVPGAAVLEAWHPIEARFGRRSMLAASAGSGWRRLLPGDLGSCTALRASLQMVSRAGVVSDVELLEFRSEVETLATRIGASVAAPEMRMALDGARDLDRTCADADIQVALHVVGIGASQDDFAGRPFQAVAREDGLTLVLDVARTADPVRAFEAMTRAARQLAGQAGRIVDDNGHSLDDRALATIEKEIDAVRASLAGRGIEPGGPLALRLFS